ncbi:hypothetical protein INR49_002756 [Caranx melampygus]|nr:hypothetical protein INR49_002756 [Caranx melampygus]
MVLRLLLLATLNVDWYGSSVRAVFCLGLSSPGNEVQSTVLILGRNWAKAGTPLSRPCNLCR